jgi:hypothetical protein
VNSFVKKCRREWKRLRVPDAVANEMAADLEADLKEAEAEGASPEEVLGTAVFDPPAFAASWAAERGVIPSPPVSKPGLNGRTPFVIAGVTLALIAALGAGMVVASHGSTRLEAIAADGPAVGFPVPAPCQRLYLPEKRPVIQPCEDLRPGSTIIRPWQGAATIVKPPPMIRAIRADVVGSTRLSAVGWTLFIVGVAGLVLLTVLSWLLGRRRALAPA